MGFFYKTLETVTGLTVCNNNRKVIVLDFTTKCQSKLSMSKLSTELSEFWCQKALKVDQYMNVGMSGINTLFVASAKEYCNCNVFL